jgi:hypothetical protein
MSIIAMCFDLMQEEIIAKFTWLGKKLGIVEDENSGEHNDEYANGDENNSLNTRKDFAYSKEKLNNLGQNNRSKETDMVTTADVIRNSRSAYLENVLLRQLKA